MNCKPGDLAVLVRSDFKQNIGVLVDVLYVSPFAPDYWVVQPLGHAVGGLLNRPERVGINGKPAHAPDSALRPIRDNPGADETLSWKSVPTVVTA